MDVIFLAAGKGSRFHGSSKVNKCLLEIKGKPLIKILIDEVKKTKIKNINIITGYRSKYLKKKLEEYKKIKFIYNKFYNKKEMTHSLMVGLEKMKNDTIVCYTDIIFESAVIDKILKKKGKNIVLPILKNWKKIWKIRGKKPSVDGETMVLKKNNVIELGNKIKQLKEVNYQYMGIIFIPKNKIKKILKIYKNLNDIKKIHLTSFLNLLIKKKMIINTIKISSGWYEFDDYEDYKNYVNKKNV